MARGLALAVVGGLTFASSAVATAATVEHDGDARVIAQADHQSESRILDDLLQRSGLKVQLESLAAGIRPLFLRTHREQSSQAKAAIDRIVSERFAPDVLYARIKGEFQRNLESRRLEQALAWYDSPLGKRITGQELGPLLNAGGPEAVGQLKRHRPTARRVALIERLDAGGGATETTVDVTVAIERTLTRAFRPGVPAEAHFRRGQLDWQTARARTREDTRRLCLASMSLAYRDLSDDELERYVQFVESEAGQWYMSVMNHALLAAIDTAAATTASELAAALPQLVGDLR